jgi:molybdenum cofactor sulfurtransferase
MQDTYPQLAGQVYLDNAGITVPSIELLQECFALLSGSLFGNPHSFHESSRRSAEQIELVRTRLLEIFQADSSRYNVVFTSGATASLKVVGECFPFDGQRRFFYTESNHNSVLGIREFAVSRNSSFHMLGDDDALHQLESFATHKQSTNSDALASSGLFAFPAQCNFTGRKFSLDWIAAAQRLGYAGLNNSASYRLLMRFSDARCCIVRCNIAIAFGSISSRLCLHFVQQDARTSNGTWCIDSHQ